MSCQPSISLLRSICKERPEQTIPVQSTTGAIIFYSYIGLALLLTGAIISSQFGAYQAICSRTRLKSRANRQLLLRCLLAITSFVVLSYHMLFFLIDSYTDWIVKHEADLPSDMRSVTLWHLQHIWEWSTYTPLFATFASDVFVIKEADGIIFLALAWEMIVAILITIDGRQRKIPKVWCYSFLAQILPISFIQNLFGIATLLNDLSQTLDLGLEHGHSRTKTQQDQTVGNTQRQEFVEIVSSTVVNCFYGIVIGSLPVLRGTNLLMPGILLTRALLLLQSAVPSLCTYPRYTSTRTLRTTALSTLVLVMANGLPYLKMNNGQSRQVYDTLFSNPAMLPWSSFNEVYLALQSNHAIAALGWDIVIGVVSAILCTIL